MLSPSEAAAHSRYLDPPNRDDRECPDCRKAKARHMFFERFRDLLEEIAGIEEANEILSPNNVYLDEIKTIADRIEDEVEAQVRREGGTRCFACFDKGRE